MNCRELSARQVLTVDASSADVTLTSGELFMMPPVLDLYNLCPPSILEIILLRLSAPAHSRNYRQEPVHTVCYGQVQLVCSL